MAEGGSQIGVVRALRCCHVWPHIRWLASEITFCRQEDLLRGLY
jgi:hypothetical protein